MIDFLKQNKLLSGALVLALFGGLFYALSGASSSPALLTQEPTVSPETQQLLDTLSRLNQIKLDDAIFSDAEFLSLTDFGVQLPAQSVGRRNPFLPIGSGGAPFVNLTVPTPL